MRASPSTGSSAEPEPAGDAASSLALKLAHQLGEVTVLLAAAAEDPQALAAAEQRLDRIVGELREVAAGGGAPADAAHAPGGAAVDLPRPQGPVRVVLADDSVDLLDVMRSLLERNGIEVAAEAGDGALAVELAERLAPDVVVMDVSMPGPPAAEVIAAIRALPSSPAVVVYTGWPAGDLAGPGVTVVPKSADPASLSEGVISAAAWDSRG